MIFFNSEPISTHSRATSTAIHIRSIFSVALFSLVMLSLFAKALHAQEGGGADGASNSATESSPVEPSPSDTDPPEEQIEVNDVLPDNRIQQRIQKILTSSQWIEEIKVEVSDGVVVLKGLASDDEKKDWASRMSSSVEGVVAVQNDLEIKASMGFNLDESLEHVTESLLSLWRDFLSRLPLILVGFLVLVATWGISKGAIALVRRSSGKARVRENLSDLFVQLTTFSIWTFGIMVAAIVVFPGMTPAKLLTVLGLGSVALGFAFKDIFENFFAGILILWRFPLDRGDFIECEDIEGKVEDITIRMTTIRQVDGQLVVVPNAVLFKNAVNILTNKKIRRTTVICGVAYDEDVDASREVIKSAVQDCSTVSDEKPVEIFAQEFAASSINFEVTWWTGSTPLDIRRSRDEVVASVKQSLDEAGIEIPFPYRTLTFKEPLSVANSAADKNSGDQTGQE
ncbi:Small-conductance mechanosensitive channel [Polystyrenella longa]|uniref:Small-conductance mechanosensitive channel n=2 Tax=Polystyrenella longa TaxID=2528007 RepID=A0A518CLD6_9PLAN|nr:Small-conductance mechanosensitive channel [Polystyrenella longa]